MSTNVQKDGPLPRTAIPRLSRVLRRADQSFQPILMRIEHWIQLGAGHVPATGLRSVSSWVRMLNSISLQIFDGPMRAAPPVLYPPGPLPARHAIGAGFPRGRRYILSDFRLDNEAEGGEVETNAVALLGSRDIVKNEPYRKRCCNRSVTLMCCSGGQTSVVLSLSRGLRWKHNCQLSPACILGPDDFAHNRHTLLKRLKRTA